MRKKILVLITVCVAVIVAATATVSLAHPLRPVATLKADDIKNISVIYGEFEFNCSDYDTKRITEELTASDFAFFGKKTELVGNYAHIRITTGSNKFIDISAAKNYGICLKDKYYKCSDELTKVIEEVCHKYILSEQAFNTD